MQTIAEENSSSVLRLHPVLPDITVSETWAYEETYALQLFEAAYEQLLAVSSLTQQDLDALQRKINVWFRERNDNYWYTQARMNTLATRLPKKPQAPTTSEQWAYPISLRQLDTVAGELAIDHAYFASGRVAREWMKHWLAEEGKTTFHSDEEVYEAMTQSAAAFQDVWEAFQQLEDEVSFTTWMEEAVGVSPALFPMSDYYAIYQSKAVWGSLTTFQRALPRLTNQQTTALDILAHPFARALALQEWIK